MGLGFVFLTKIGDVMYNVMHKEGGAYV